MENINHLLVVFAAYVIAAGSPARAPFGSWAWR